MKLWRPLAAVFWLAPFVASQRAGAQSPFGFDTLSTPGAILQSQLPTSKIIDPFGREPIHSVASQRIAFIDTSGAPHSSQPSFADNSGKVTGAQMAVGAAAANLSATSCNAIGARACVTGSGPIRFTDVQNFGTGHQVGGNEVFFQSSNDHSSAFLSFGKTRSTVHGSGPGTPVQPGDGLSEINVIADDGASFHDSASDNFSVDDVVSTGIVPTSHQIWVGNTKGTHTLAALSDSRGNFYLRNGYLGIGSALGYNPPSTYTTATAPVYPITVKEAISGTVAGFWYPNSTGGGAQIETWNGFKPARPVYGFWYNSGSGIGNPSANVTSVVTNNAESWRVDAFGHVSTTSAMRPSVSACGTAPSLDAQATDNSGTIKTGSGALSSCTVTFINAYKTYNHCRISPHNLGLGGAGYSYTLAAITITATTLTSQVIDYDCDGK